MPVEFISASFVNDSTELNPTSSTGIDPKFLVRYARVLDDAGFDYTLLPYGSSGWDPFGVAAAVSQHTERVKPLVALRPNIMYPTVAAKALATLDQLSGGRAAVHIISGGDTAEQAREGDRLDKSGRYERSAEYIEILRKVWASDKPFDHSGTYYQFEDFHSSIRPAGGSIPVSVGGSSADAYRVGGALGDIFGLWGEPLAETKEQMDAVFEQAALAGRVDRPRIWVTFRPIIAPTEELAWEKAHRTLAQLNKSGGWSAAKPSTGAPQNVGSQRLLEIAARGEVHDRALWTPTATATGARGASTALVGTPETVAAAILDYVDLGAELISIRGYDNLNDAIDYGRYVLPLVRQELALREKAA
ncbi:LLM class flavin-dependent oxidoreductase [Rhodococcus sp. 06-462-5]|uniref:LLM class flavin-dependent oxidoreductase n=1 Tax=Nocardiaceae TaxID=85025 RepID=UPI00050C0E57|nr:MULTISPECIES: LLM class flavin-dependent oxidoreductase [Rhodococcus]OZC73906.1 LLM class flavin-dependent oxidoreductase [Rhodococcus sp. 06-462-5]OZE67903.1 LLM class flavin-dependent oxidoreductase [Rhodococcus sp. 02-925g]OZF51092.1 LLM class flavin-dependent oxidoreductase [Rhodococcus sp. 14-1411-2a]